MTYETNPRVRISGLYENTSKNGNRYLVGYWGNTKLIAFENKERSEKEPHFTLYLEEKPKENGQQRQQAKPPQPVKQAAMEAQQPTMDDYVPF